jgi:RNA polymerase sigma factor (sigma-70 family)
LDELNDPKFVRALVAGDADAFSVFCHTLNRKLPEFIVRETGLSYHDAEEVAGDVYFKLHRKIREYEARPGVKLTTWVFEIAKNAAIDARRKVARLRGENKDRDIDDDQEKSPLQQPSEKKLPALPRLAEFEEQVLGGSDRAQTKKIIPYKVAFDKLKEPEKDILRMRNIMDYAEISVVESQNVVALRVRHTRARQRLRELSEKGGQ